MSYKNILRLVLAIFALALLAACSQEEPEPTAAPIEEPTEAPTEVPTEEPTEIPTEVPTEEPVEEPTEETTEEPTEEPATPTPEPVEVQVDMVDFTYEPVTVTVSAGTSIIFFNAGEIDHSATADDAAWDTGVYSTGEEAAITFDTPGTFPYYCVLHGTPGGNGMAGTVIVTEE
jgi:plastocyanin